MSRSRLLKRLSLADAVRTVPRKANSREQRASRWTAYAQSPMGHGVEVVRPGEWWAITVPSLRGVFSQASHLDEVPAAAREAIALMLDVDTADVGPIDVHVQDQGGAGALT